MTIRLKLSENWQKLGRDNEHYTYLLNINNDQCLRISGPAFEVLSSITTVKNSVLTQAALEWFLAEGVLTDADKNHSTAAPSISPDLLGIDIIESLDVSASEVTDMRKMGSWPFMS